MGERSGWFGIDERHARGPCEPVRHEPSVIPAEAGIQIRRAGYFREGQSIWIPAFAGMTGGGMSALAHLRTFEATVDLPCETNIGNSRIFGAGVLKRSDPNRDLDRFGGVYISFPHPIHYEATLMAVAAEAQHLIATNPVSLESQFVAIPKDQWPSTIASLKPYSVTVTIGMVDITKEPHFDGGWGYGFATDKGNLTMLVECWSELGHHVYWHGPC